jgi:putative transposase
MHEEQGYDGETASQEWLFGVPQRRPFRNKRTGVRPEHMKNHPERDFVALEPNTKWVTDITCIHKGESWLYPCRVLALYSHKIVGWSMSGIQDCHRVIKAVLMACWQCPGREPLALHSDRLNPTNSPVATIGAPWPTTTSCRRSYHCGGVGQG